MTLGSPGRADSSSKLGDDVLQVLRSNTGFCRVVYANVGWVIEKAAINPALEAILQSPDRYLSEAGPLLKDSRSSTIASVGGYVIKRYNLRRPWKWVKANLRGSYARRAFLSACHLELAGVPGAHPVAFGDCRRFGLLIRSYLITQAIPGARQLDQLAERPKEVICAVARAIARLHEEGFRQRDPKPSNILLGPRNGVHLVDTDGIRFVRRVSRQAAGRDLDRLMARLALVPDDRELFVRAYKAD